MWTRLFVVSQRIEKAADLPRFTYKIDGKVEDLLRDDAKFRAFATDVRRDAESTLAKYDIADKSSERQLRGIGKTSDERNALARQYFDIQKNALTKAMASAPAIVFVAAAGNSNEDASFAESIPADIVPPNLITVGAVDKSGDEASFTSYGPTVVVDASGYQVESYIPGGERIPESGTSMASPQVANLAGKILAVNPKLKPTEVIAIIRSAADKTTDGRRTLINPKKAVDAATMNKAA